MTNTHDWSKAPKEANILVQNEDGTWVYGTYKNAEYDINDGTWIGKDKGSWLHYIEVPIQPPSEIPWTQSIQKRPTSEFTYPIYKISIKSKVIVEFIALSEGYDIDPMTNKRLNNDPLFWTPHNNPSVWKNWTPSEKVEEDLSVTPKQDNKYAKQFTNRMKQKIKEALQTANGDFNHIDWSTVTYDFYDVANSFSITCPMQQHGVKKLLVLGNRNGGKSYKQDLEESLWSLQESVKELR